MDENNVFHNTAATRYNYVVPSPQGPVSTLGWEAKREDINDYRYLLTLSRRMDQAKRSSNRDTQQLGVEAQSVIDAMMAKIPVEVYTDIYHRGVDGGFVNPLPVIEPDDYDQFLRTLAGWIIRIDQQLKPDNS